jgi:hypothetical protein
VALFIVENGRLMGFPSGEPIQLKVGDKIGFSVRPPMDSRLYVMNFDPQSSEDSVIFLYPLPQFGAKLFRRDTTYEFPRSIDPNALSYPVDPPAGRMVFKIIGVDASQERVDLARGLESHHGYYQMDPGALKVFLKDLSSLPASAWWEETIEFWVTE